MQRAPAAAPALSGNEVSENDEISVLQARDGEVMRATIQYCGVDDNAELVREITEAVSSDVGMLVVCAGLMVGEHAALVQLPVQFARRARSRQAPLGSV